MSASEVDPALLIAFYKTMYPQRVGFLKDNWSWLNRSSYLNNKTPLVLVLENQVIAHAGMIPAEISSHNYTYTAAWFIDLAVLPEFQGFGYGSILVKKRMEFTEMQMTFPNDRSFKIFKKLGWQEPSVSYMHYTLISPFNHPKFKGLPSPLRALLNFVVFSFLSKTYKKYADRSTGNHLIQLDDVSLNHLYESYKQSLKNLNNFIHPNRDDDYVRWRILDSPNRNRYYIYTDDEFSALVFLNDRIGYSVDILWVSDINKMPEIRKMLSALALAGKKEGYSYIRFYTTRNDLSAYIKRYVKSVVKFRKFVYTSKNKLLLDEFKKSTWALELIDSDLEHTN